MYGAKGIVIVSRQNSRAGFVLTNPARPNPILLFVVLRQNSLIGKNPAALL